MAGGPGARLEPVPLAVVIGEPSRRLRGMAQAPAHGDLDLEVVGALK